MMVFGLEKDEDLVAAGNEENRKTASKTKAHTLLASSLPLQLSATGKYLYNLVIAVL